MFCFTKYQKIDNRSWDFCHLIQKYVFIHFFNNQKLLTMFNKIDVIGGKSLAKPWLNIYIP